MIEGAHIHVTVVLVELLVPNVSQFRSAISTGPTVKLSLVAIIAPNLRVSAESNVTPEVTAEDLTWFDLTTQLCFNKDHNICFGVIHQNFESTSLIRDACAVSNGSL